MIKQDFLKHLVLILFILEILFEELFLVDRSNMIK